MLQRIRRLRHAYDEDHDMLPRSGGNSRKHGRILPAQDFGRLSDTFKIGRKTWVGICMRSKSPESFVLTYCGKHCVDHQIMYSQGGLDLRVHRLMRLAPRQ